MQQFFSRIFPLLTTTYLTPDATRANIVREVHGLRSCRELRGESSWKQRVDPRVREIRSNDTGFLLPFLEEHVPPLMDDWNYSTRYFAEFNALAHRPRYHDYLRWYINGIPGLPGSINILVNLRQEFPPACSRSSLTLQPPRQ